jgi:hypothetical protein
MCIYESVVDPAHVVELTSPEARGKEQGASTVKDLRKNSNRAEKEEVDVVELKEGEWSVEDRRAVDEGLQKWKKARNGLQIAAVNETKSVLSFHIQTVSQTSLQPWLDSEHRRYWLARKDNKVTNPPLELPITFY